MIIVMMIITWYLTKIYYTHRFTVEFNDKVESGQICFHCGKKEYPEEGNKRSPYYCGACR
jgi:hypothetical protein